VDTLLLSELPKSNRDELEKRIPSGRFAEPAEVAGVVEYLFEDKGGYITGSIIPIDGGLGASVS
jgi:NAD(P)-dependent dehydrogenase (short-subunit alcohol dehydrogenase family)